MNRKFPLKFLKEFAKKRNLLKKEELEKFKEKKKEVSKKEKSKILEERKKLKEELKALKLKKLAKEKAIEAKEKMISSYQKKEDKIKKLAREAREKIDAKKEEANEKANTKRAREQDKARVKKEKTNDAEGKRIKKAIPSNNPKTNIFMLKSRIKRLLEVGSWKVTFQKVNGDKRIMNCTRNFKFVGSNSGNWKAPKGIRKTPGHLVVVWDLDKDDWRCFRMTSIYKNGLSKNTERLKKDSFGPGQKNKRNFSEQKEQKEILELIEKLKKEESGKIFYDLKKMKPKTNFSIKDFTMVGFYPEDLFLEAYFDEIPNDDIKKLSEILDSEQVNDILKKAEEYLNAENLNEDEQAISDGAYIVKQIFEKNKRIKNVK